MSGINSQNLFFSHLDVQDGLSHSTVLSIYQDEYGQMWFGTRNGLNRYNGNNTQRVNLILNGKKNLYFNDIKTVCGDKKGKIFLLSMQQLIVYDSHKEIFEEMKLNRIRAIHYSDDKLWIGTSNKLYYLTSGDSEIKEFMELDSNDSILDIICASDSSIYIGTDTKLTRVDLRTKKQETIIKGVKVRCVYEDSKKNIWIGTLQDGLFVYTPPGGDIVNFRASPQDKNSISSDFVRTIVEDNLGNYWIGTYGGLNHFDYETSQFSNYTHSINDSHSISDFSVHSIMKDSQGSLWIGTNFGGANFINPEFSFDKYYNKESGLSGEILSNVAEDDKGNLWICTDDGGLNYFDRSTNTFQHIRHKGSGGMGLNNTALKASLLDERNNCLWIGSNLGGLFKVDLSTRLIEKVPLRTNDPDVNNFVRAILKYGDKLIIGTHNSVHLYDPILQILTPLFEGKQIGIKQVWDMILDSEENLWVSSATNIYCVNMASGDISPVHRVIGRNRLSVFYEDSNKRIWIGSAGQGLYLYNPKDKSYTHFTTSNSKIIDDYILDIAEAPSGALLLTTNAGLSRYDIDNKSFSNYYLNQFFPFKAFNERSLLVTRSGEIVLCSYNGMMILNEKDLDIAPKPYALNFTDLSINNQAVVPNDETSVLKKSISETDTITLQESHTVFSVDVFNDNYLTIISPQVKYKLEGFDDKWVDLKSKRTISYTNLEAKTYTLRVFASDDFSGFVTPEKTLTIIVEPYFYKTWYAYIFYTLFVLGMLYIFISRLFLKNSLRYAKYKAAHIKEINESKMRFFINVSHEIRTPITLIAAQIDYLVNDTNSSAINNRLLNMKRNAQKLRDLINELLDFRKQESGLITLNIEEVEIVRYLENILNTFKEYGQTLGVSRKFTTELERTILYIDSVQMDKVFYNLLSNAYKFTPRKGEIHLSIKSDDENAIIDVADTGIGIKPEDVAAIFNRFYQVEDRESVFSTKSEGTGIGLSLVKSIIELHHGTVAVFGNEGRGSVFRVTIPFGSRHFEDEKNIQFVKQENIGVVDKAVAKNNMQQLGIDANKELLVYVVEDNQDLRNILIDIFSPLYRVKSFENAESAYESIELDMPNIVILDVMLPKMSGIELCSQIKTNLATLHIPIILLTAATGANEKIEGLLKGADDYIYKPFDISELLVRCNNLIRSRLSLAAMANTSCPADELSKAISSKDKDFLEKLSVIIKQNLDNPSLNVDMLAEGMNLARTSLFLRVKEITASTPNALILDIRMGKALEIIKSDRDVLINEVAYEVGFQSPSYFINIFKSHYGVTPNEFKKSYFNLDK